MTNNNSSQKFLRFVLRTDALASGGIAVASLTMAPMMKDMFGTAIPLSLGVGAFLTVFAIGLWILSSQAEINRLAVWTVIIGNLGWVAASVALALSGKADLTALGTGYVLLQAAGVLLFADLEFMGLRKARA